MTDRKNPGDLTLNGLDRFRKHSSRVVVEAYSHCEVPAGCGGNVWRYSDAQSCLPLTIRVASGGVAQQIWLDGQQHTGSWMDLKAGRHRICLSIAPAASTNFLLLHLAYDPRRERYVTGPVDALKAIQLKSDSSGWLVSAREPAGEWLEAQHEPGKNWVSPAIFAANGVLKDKNTAYQFDAVINAGALPIGIQKHSGALWVQRTFELCLSEEFAIV